MFLISKANKIVPLTEIGFRNKNKMPTKHPGRNEIHPINSDVIADSLRYRWLDKREMSATEAAQIKQKSKDCELIKFFGRRFVDF